MLQKLGTPFLRGLFIQTPTELISLKFLTNFENFAYTGKYHPRKIPIEEDGVTCNSNFLGLGVFCP
jgi:hypothetical protein